jgi:pimeloyl-ACP methyl ester carboxylesterase
MYRDVVVLMPGFLGFSHFGGFYYFADRIAAALRAALEIEAGHAVPVIPLSAVPTSSLESRHAYLLDMLSQLESAVGGFERLHLVGHSAGGVDAFLLTQEQPFRGVATSASFRGKIRSVITIASPHYGTGLAGTDFAQALVNPLSHVAGLPAVGRTFVDVLRFVARDPELPEGFSGALQDWQQSLGFLSNVLQHRELIQDLRPDRMADLQSRCRPDPSVPAKLTCFVTATAPPTNAAEPVDPLYRDLYAFTASGVSHLAPAAKQALRMLDLVPVDKIIRSPGGVPVSVGPSTSDGVVNSAYQLAHPEDLSEFGGLVIADHGDVIGHYPRVDLLTTLPSAGAAEPREVNARRINPGLFHSGAAFRDDQLFELYRRVAVRIRDAG